MDGYYLRTWSDPILTKNCRPVEDFSDLDFLIDTMYSIMTTHSGVGIAAPQVGDDRRVIIAKSKVFINPIILTVEGTIRYTEGCLSFPGSIVEMERGRRIEVEYQNRSGKYERGIFKNRDAVILQHEIDHLNGKIIYHP
jgi:peptide deformylase